MAALLADTWLLVQLRWLLAWNTFRSARLIRKIFSVIGALALVVFVGGGSGLVGLTFGSILRRFPQLELEPLAPGLILSLVTALLLLNSFGVALGALFLSNDLELLMTAPVRRRAVLISKILDGMMTYFLLSLVFGGPALLTYGLGLRYGPLYYVFALFYLIITPLFPAAVGSLLVMVIARFAPLRRVREVMGLAAALFGVGCSVLSNTTRFWSRLGLDRADLNSLLEAVQRIASLPLPPMLAGQSLVVFGALEGNWGLALAGLISFTAMTLGTFAAGVWLAESLYAAGWLRMQGSGAANRNTVRAARAARRTGLLGDAAPPLAVALKDWRVIPRDLRNFAQFLAPLFLLPVIYLNLFGGGGRDNFNAIEEANAFGRGLVDFTNVFAAAGILFTASLVINRIAQTAISMEGKSYWLLKAAPISERELLLGKFVAAMVPFSILSTLMFVGVAIWRGFSAAGTLYGLFGVLLLGAGNFAIEVGMAVPWANLNWDDPRRMSSGWGGLFAFLISIVNGSLAGLSLSLPLIVRVLAPDLEWLGWVFGPLLGVGFTVLIAGAAFGFGLSRLPYVGEA